MNPKVNLSHLCRIGKGNELLHADNDRFSACRQTVPTPGSYHLHRNKWKNVSRDKASRKLRQAITL